MRSHHAADRYDTIQAEIEQLETECRELDDQLDALDEFKRELPKLEAKQEHLDAQIEEKCDELEATEADLAGGRPR